MKVGYLFKLGAIFASVSLLLHFVAYGAQDLQPLNAHDASIVEMVSNY